MKFLYPTLILFLVMWALPLLAAATSAYAGEAPTAGAASAIPTLFIASDSTAASNTPNAMGWGRVIGRYFDGTRITINNLGQSGLSSRTYYNSRWQGLLNQVKAHDFVIIQFGHNDNGPIDTGRMRGTAPSLGEETVEFTPPNGGPPEVVHTFGWYMRKMIQDTLDKGAVPIVVSMTPRGEWKDGKVERGFGPYGRLAGEVARAQGVRFIDLTNIVADEYERLGPEKVKAFHPQDTTHTSSAGADLNARSIIAGIKALRENALIRTLSAEGRAIEPAPYEQIMVPRLAVPRGASPEVFERWLNLPEVADPSLPSIFLIGDSTVRNGRGDALDGQWGWGDPLAAHLDLSKVNLVNRAVGGTTARSYQASRWQSVLGMLKAGDFLLIQFGTNSAGENGAQFSDALRKYIADTKAKGATPILCTLVPRNVWANGKVTRTDQHAEWTRSVATEQKVALLDLSNLLAGRYEGLGQPATTALFADGRLHTNRAGAELTAEVVAGALKALPENPLGKYFRQEKAPTW